MVLYSVMKCERCKSKSFQHDGIDYRCYRCEIGYRFYGHPIDHCPECNQSDLYMICRLRYECLQCHKCITKMTPEYKFWRDNRHHNWHFSRLYPIDLEELCIEAFKPSRVMYRMTIDDNYDEY